MTRGDPLPNTHHRPSHPHPLQEKKEKKDKKEKKEQNRAASPEAASPGADGGTAEKV